MPYVQSLRVDARFIFIQLVLQKVEFGIQLQPIWILGNLRIFR